MDDCKSALFVLKLMRLLILRALSKLKKERLNKKKKKKNGTLCKANKTLLLRVQHILDLMHN